MSVNPIPDGFTAVTPYLIVDGAAAAIAFYRDAFAAEEVMRLSPPGSEQIVHAEITIAGARLMLADPNPAMNARSARSLGGSPVSLLIYTEDADALFARAVAAGAEPTVPVSETFWGARHGMVTDPFGLRWSIATQIFEPTPAQIEAGMKAMAGG